MDGFAARGALLARFSPDAPATEVLHRSDRHEVTVTAYEPYQESPAWPTEINVTVTVLEGVGDVSIGDHVVAVSHGDVCIIPAGTVGAVRSHGRRLITLQTAAPAPSDCDPTATSAAAWLGDLIRHTEVEELALYPAVERLLGDRRGATATMSLDNDACTSPRSGSTCRSSTCSAPTTATPSPAEE
jgi:quercetin dioxygenase-like cupin family protein